MGLLGTVFKVVALLVLAVVGLGAFLYFTDYAAEATIKEKGRDAEGDYVVIRPAFVPRDFRQAIDADAARFVCEGYSVTYRIQTGHYVVYDEGGGVVYDSDSGLASGRALVDCARLGI